jgi:hypothetical protein
MPRGGADSFADSPPAAGGNGPGLGTAGAGPTASVRFIQRSPHHISRGPTESAAASRAFAGDESFLLFQREEAAEITANGIARPFKGAGEARGCRQVRRRAAFDHSHRFAQASLSGQPAPRGAVVAEQKGAVSWRGACHQGNATSSAGKLFMSCGSAT